MKYMGKKDQESQALSVLAYEELNLADPIPIWAE
jgi:hypothetical protein